MNHSTDWREVLTRIWTRAHIPAFADDARFTIEALIAQVEQEAYERGVEDAIKKVEKASGYGTGNLVPRQRIIQSLRTLKTTPLPDTKTEI